MRIMTGLLKLTDCCPLKGDTYSLSLHCSSAQSRPNELPPSLSIPIESEFTNLVPIRVPSAPLNPFVVIAIAATGPAPKEAPDVEPESEIAVPTGVP